MAAPAALAVTDMQGSTALWERHGPAFAAVLAEHNRIVGQAIAAAGGRTVRTEGDSFVAAFPDACGAVRFAADVQARLHATPWPAEIGEILVRVGACRASADVAASEARATRVAGAAHGGQSLLTEDLRGAAPADAALVDLGELALHGDAPPERLWQAVHPSLAARRFPPPRAPRPRRTNLPAETNAFFGRTTEIAALSDLLPRPEGRLVTLTGPAGIGKTRLAVHSARALAPRFAGGAWIADVSECSGAGGVASAVAEALGIPLSGSDDPARVVAEALASRPPLLLVLDGFEPVAAHAAATIGTWIQRARGARFLVASRVLLRIAGEREIAVPPLTAPAKRAREETAFRAVAPTDWEAVLLFADRATAVSPEWRLDAAGGADVARLCGELEGIPLAIELAAARVRDSSPERILQELRSRAAAPEAVRAALSWTLDRLQPWERSVFAQACLFRGGFTLEAAEAVIDLSAYSDAGLAMDGIQALRDRSLLRTWDTPLGTRFGMFRSVRDEAASLLARGGGTETAEAVLRRHALHFTDRGEEWRKRIFSREPAEGLDRIRAEEENILVACDGSAEEDPGLAARALLTLTEILAMNGPMELLAARGGPLFADPRVPPRVAAALAPVLARCLWVLGRGDEAIAVCDRGVRLASEAGSAELEARVLLKRAEMHDDRGEPEAAMSCISRGIELARAGGDPLLPYNGIAIRAILHLSADRYDDAIRDFSEAVARFREAGDWFHLAKFTSNLGAAHRLRGDRDAALACYDEAGKLFRSIDNRNDLAAVIANRGIILHERGDQAGCERAFEESAAIHRETGNRAALGLVVGNMAALHVLEKDYPRALARLAEVEEIWRALGARTRLATVHRERGEVLVEMGRCQEALSSMELARETYTAGGATSDAALCRIEEGEYLRRLGRGTEAMERVRGALGELTGDGVDQWWGRVLGCATLARAEADAGRPDAAREAARQGLQAAAKLGDRVLTRGRGREAAEDLRRHSAT